MDVIRRSVGISRLDRIRNEVVKQKMGIEGTIVEDIERKQLIWYGHVARMPENRLPKQVMEWQSEGRQSRMAKDSEQIYERKETIN